MRKTMKPTWQFLQETKLRKIREKQREKDDKHKKHTLKSYSAFSLNNVDVIAQKRQWINRILTDM